MVTTGSTPAMFCAIRAELWRCARGAQASAVVKSTSTFARSATADKMADEKACGYTEASHRLSKWRWFAGMALRQQRPYRDAPFAFTRILFWATQGGGTNRRTRKPRRSTA